MKMISEKSQHQLYYFIRDCLSDGADLNEILQNVREMYILFTIVDSLGFSIKTLLGERIEEAKKLTLPD